MRIKAIAVSLEQFKKDAILLEEYYQKLSEKHPGCWAGVRRGELKIARNLAKLCEDFGGGKNVAVRHLDPNSKKLIL